MELDDKEALLLSTWVRTGLWVLPDVAAQLTVRAVPPLPPRRSGVDGEDEEEALHRGPTTWVELRLRGGGKVGTRGAWSDERVVAAAWLRCVPRACTEGAWRPL